MRAQQKRQLRTTSLAELNKKLQYLKSKLKPNQKETRKIKYVKYHIRKQGKAVQ